MKYCADYIVGRNHIVAPLAGAWIEIFLLHSKQPFLLVAPLAGAWIEIRMEQWCHGIRRVAPLAGAWIEMSTALFLLLADTRRSPRGSVD